MIDFLDISIVWFSHPPWMQFGFLLSFLIILALRSKLNIPSHKYHRIGFSMLTQFSAATTLKWLSQRLRPYSCFVWHTYFLFCLLNDLCFPYYPGCNWHKFASAVVWAPLNNVEDCEQRWLYRETELWISLLPFLCHVRANTTVAVRFIHGVWSS
jgi:hypothetical protein